MAAKFTPLVFAPPSTTPMADKAAALAALQAEIGPDCRRCPLAKQGRERVVFGEGSPNAPIMFIGEGPGADEDRTGRPFVGTAGQLLTRMIYGIGYTRAEVYIANVVKCRPPGNRQPEPDEASVCAHFVVRQLDIIRPQVVVLLGGTAMKWILGIPQGISHQRGKWLEFRGIPTLPTFHPAYLARNPAAKPDAWTDMKTVAERVDPTRPLRGRAEVERLMTELKEV